MQTGDLIAKRYRTERLIGSGGAAEVYEVTDLATDVRVALKRLAAPQAHGKLAEVMFAREYNALAQLAHPLIIRAFDYGRDGGVPYYTMELLAGENLRNVAPLDWQEACHVLRDVASALGIIHSRKLLHRDVTTRNVCRVEGGRAKLIDFGALTPMGRVRELVGTPPFVPPEALDDQRLDGRADLFALGAVAYYVLTGQHAYPATRFRDLSDAWRFPLAPPSSIISGIPDALDELVLSLLSLSRTARPQNAAEVFQRLTAIADLPVLDGPEIAQAYLATPSLVGRDRALGIARKYTERLRRSRGFTLLLEGNRGVGRTRLLSAFLLEAKLRGAVTVRIAGRDSDGAPFQLVHGLARELLGTDAVLGEDAYGDESARLSTVVAEAVSASDDWLVTASRIAYVFASVAEKTSLVLAVDDVDAADDQSLATLALIAQRARSLPLGLFLTTERKARGKAMTELRRSSTSLGLEAFTKSDTASFVSSLFGDVPHVEAIADWMHRLAEGNARMTLELSQHLADRGVARYRDGTWVLPASLDGLGLPQTIEQALEEKMLALSPAARELLQTLSLMTDHGPLLVSEYASLAEGANVAPTFAALNELIASGIVVSAGAAYVFAEPEMVPIARRSIPEARLPELHRRLAAAYESGDESAHFQVVYHLHQAGELARAFAELVRDVSRRVDVGGRAAGLLRSQAGATLVEALFLWGIEQRAPRREMVLLGRKLLQLASVVDVTLSRHADLVLEPLRAESGLVYLDEVEGDPDPVSRIQKCLVRAYAAYEQTPEPERGLDPREAIAELATWAGSLAGVYTRTYDAKRMGELGDLLEPVRALSPAVDVIAEILECAGSALRGHYVYEQRTRVIQRLSSPIPGLDDLSRQEMFLLFNYYCALEEASYGRPCASDRVRPLEAFPQTAPLAWQVRMLLYLFLGDEERASEARRRRDAVSIGRVDVDQHFESGAIYDAFVRYTLGDVVALGRAMHVVTDFAKTRPEWRPYAHILAGHHHSLRGEVSKALEAYEKAHALLPVAGVHNAWGLCRDSYATVLIEAGRAADAERLLESALEECSSMRLVPYVLAQFRMTLALAKASLGKSDEARALAKESADAMRKAGVFGVVLLANYVKRALVALRVGDQETFDAAVRVVEGMCAETGNPSFAAKHEFLLRRLRGTDSFRPAPVVQMEIVTRRESHTTLAVGLRVDIESCQTATERAERALAVVLEWSGAETGFLFVQSAGAAVLSASSEGIAVPESLEDVVAAWVQAFLSGPITSRTSSPLDSGSGETVAFDLIALVAHPDGRPVLAGVAALSRTGPGRPVPESVLEVLGEALLKSGDAAGIALEG